MSKYQVETWRQSLKFAGVALLIWVGIVLVALIAISFCFYIKIVQERNDRIEALSQMSERHDYQQFRSLKNRYYSSHAVIVVIMAHGFLCIN